MVSVNRHIISAGDIKVVDSELNNGKFNTNTINYTNYDDTKIKERLSRLEVEVEEIHETDAGFQRRLSALENADFATKDELNGVERRVTKLEVDPVGLTDSKMDEIFD